MHKVIIPKFFNFLSDKHPQLNVKACFCAFVLGIFFLSLPFATAQTIFPTPSIDNDFSKRKLEPGPQKKKKIEKEKQEKKVESESKDKIDKMIESMSLRQKVGQLFIIGFRGTKINQSLSYRMNKVLPGGVITFKRNIKSPVQTYGLNKKAQRLSQKLTGHPLLIMIDQEGGSVTRIRTKPQPPSALSLGKTNNTKIVENTGFITGRILSLLGFNVNLAPVVDISDPAKKTFIGNRSFGKDPEQVKIYGHSFSQGLIESGVLPTAKHFPGHGGIIEDSHHKLPTSKKTLEELEESSLIPFKFFSKMHPDSAVMVAHISFPNIDKTGVPSTFSKVLITDVLREKFNYEGLIITDDIEMDGAESIGGVGERAIKAIEAGNDMVMVAWSPKKQKMALEAVVKAVNEDRLPLERIHESLRRILRVKSNIGKTLSESVGSKKELNKSLGRYLKDLKTITDQVAKINFRNSMNKFESLKGSVSQTQSINVFTADSKFYVTANKRVKNKVRYHRIMRKRASSIEKAMRKYPNSIGVYYVSGAGTARILNNLNPKLKSRFVVVNTTHAGQVANHGQFLAVVNLSTRNYMVGRWLMDYLVKGIELKEEIRSPATGASRKKKTRPLERSRPKKIKKQDDNYSLNN